MKRMERHFGRRLGGLVAGVFLGVVLAGCGSPSFAIHKLRGSVRLQSPAPYEYRAVTADGVVLAVRTITGLPDGDVGFWARAVENTLHARGYVKTSERPFRTKQGVAGHELRFGHDESGQPHLYITALLPSPSALFVIECGGRQELVEKSLPEIDMIIDGFETR